MHNLVSVSWLQQHLDAEHLIILDASVGTLTSKRPEPCCITNSLRFDFERQICAHSSKFPNTMPGALQLRQQLQQLGINEQSQIVVYDNRGIYSAARAWWMLKMAGHKQVAVLDGGLPAWLKAGLATAPEYKINLTEGDFVCADNIAGFCDLHYVAKQIQQDSTYVLDARSSNRFHAVELETRPGMRSGHIPGSINMPYASLQQDGQLLSQPELVDIFSPYKNKPLLLTCGSGVTACILALAASLCGREDLTVYDGSWTEWGAQDSGMPIEQ